MAARNNIFTTIRTEGALLPADLLQRISEGGNIEGLTPESYHHGGEKLNEVINRSWNALQGAWASFKAAQERLPENDLGTTITRERWLLPLFRELDYGRLQTATAVEIDGRTYPISHSWEHVPVHLVSYKLELDKRTPGAAGAASASPHSLLQVFLNRSENNLWGFLSNGYRLRILRDNASLTRQAYVEFDLQAMMEGEVYSDFVLLWLLCHQSRVEGDRPSDCWLEKWMKVAEDQGTRALDQLRNGVEAAIEALGVGFLDYPSNATLRDKLTSGELKKEEYYRQLLRMVYRLLFLFVAEDRSLLLNPNAPQDARERYIQYYSTQRLRHVAESFKGTRHPDLFESLRLVMRLLSGDDPHLPTSSPSGGRGDKVPRPEGEGFRVRVAADGLGLIPLGSFLFSDRAVTDIIDCQISNQHLLTAVRALSLTYDQRAQVYRTVDYKNLGSDELGSIFESLLELHPQINVPARRFALATAAGNERKTTGSYYTPESLVHALLDSALNPVLEEAMKGKDPQPPAPSPSGRRGVNAFGAAPSATGGAGALSAAASERGGNEPVWRTRASEAMHQISKELRGRQTPAEVILWEALRDRRLDGLKFRRQHAIANTAYVADFLCYEARLVIELDGGIHQHHREEDAIRQQNIEAEGYTVIRFTNEQVYTDPESVLTAILSTARSSSPRHEGEGLGVRVNYPEGEGFRVGADEGQTPEQRILALKVCDPACGSGHFLIAAANRIAKALATVRTGEEEPTPAAIQEAKRDVISHCIYGVDINPMAVELCKVNLWMEALEPGKPLNFLDHRIQVGNSLLGTTPKLMADGIPDDAFNPIEGDDKSAASALKKKNRDERKQREANVRQLDLFGEAPRTADYAHLTDAMHALDDTPDDTLDSVRRKEAQYAALANDPEYIKARLLADAWCAAFVWEKRPSPPQSPSPSWRGGSSSLLPAAGGHEVGEGSGMRVMTDLLYRRMEENPLADNLQPVREYVVELKERYQFFHWHVAFPDVFTVPDSPLPSETRFAGEGAGGEGQTGWHGGFDVVLGNPPWDQIQLDDREFFAVSAPEIAGAVNMNARKKMITKLAKDDPELHNAYLQAVRENDGIKHFAHASGRYPFTSFGRLNTAPLFCEAGLNIINPHGYSALIVPTGIATDSFNQYFFNHIIDSRALNSLYDFENRLGLFPAVDSRMKFCILILNGSARATDDMQFAFFAYKVSDLAELAFSLSPEDIALLNPNTRTTPIFRSKRDADLTKSVYQRVPILIREGEPDENPWNIKFQLMFTMNIDSDKFRNQEELEAEGYTPQGYRWVLNDKSYVPLYESKMFAAYDHRYAKVTLNESNEFRKGQPSENSVLEHGNALFFNQPYWYVPEHDVLSRAGSSSWTITCKRIVGVTNERTMTAALLPFGGISDSAVSAILSNMHPHHETAFTANLNTYLLDFSVRNKVSGTSIKHYIFQQLPIIPPHTYTPALLDFIVPRVLELSYTAWDLAAFAADVGWDGAPFIWDEERRFLMRCELDALYFHLYQISRDDVDYIMETFPIVKRKDEAKHGEYLTKRIILEMYDQMAALAKVAVPAPKDESAMYLVPDVSQWETWLNPPPASPDVAHEG